MSVTSSSRRLARSRRVEERFTRTAPIKRKDARRRKLEDAAINGLRRGNVAPADEGVEAVAVDLGTKVGMLADGLQFGGEDQVLPAPAIIERLLTEAVAHEVQSPLACIHKAKANMPDADASARSRPQAAIA